MNRGVEILLARMDSHPEEFEHMRNRDGFGRWDFVISLMLDRHHTNHSQPAALPFLSNQEIDALYQKYMSVQGNAFTKRVMRELLDADKEQEQGATDVFTTTARFSR